MGRAISVLVLGAIVLLGTAVASWAALIDVTLPGDPVVRVDGVNDGDGSSGPPPAGEVESHAIDDLTDKYLNFLDWGSGFMVTPAAGATTVVGLRLYTANDAEPRDPASYLLEGSNGGTGGPFTLISQGALALPMDRNAKGILIGTPGLAYQELTFANSTAYTTYRLTFPTLRDAGAANSMQIGEVEFLADTTPPPPPFDLTQPGDTIVGTSNNYPGGDKPEGPSGPEGPPQTIDNNPATKYLNFDKEGAGFIVTLDSWGGPAALNGIALTTANDTPGRDPASVTIRGSNDGTTWVPIVTDLVTDLPDDRFTEREFAFVPETGGAYLMYEVTFPTLKDTGGAGVDSVQIGEVRLLPEPATLALVGLGLAGLAARRRRA